MRSILGCLRRHGPQETASSLLRRASAGWALCSGRASARATG